MNKEIILLFCLILYCSSSTEDVKLLNHLLLGQIIVLSFLVGLELII